MGTLTPILGTLTSTIGALETLSTTIDTVSGRDERLYRAQQDQAMQNLKAQQSLSVQQAQDKAEADRKRLALDAKEAEKRRRDALKRAIAKQNARRGAGGVSSGGSNEAVLLGLYNDADDDRSYSNALDQLRYNTIDRNLSSMQSRNVLEQTQLSERQRLDRAIQNY